MKQGYFPENNNPVTQPPMQTSRRQPRQTNARSKKQSNKRQPLTIAAIVVGVIIFLATDSTGFRVFILGLVLFLIYRRSFKKPSAKTNITETIPQTTEQTIQPVIQSQNTENLELPQTSYGIPISYQYHNVNIAMVSEFIKNFQTIQPGDQINFKPEPTNQYDPKAIQLWSNNQLLGYVYRGKIQDMLHDFLEQGNPKYSMVDAVLPDEKKITYSIGFYRAPRFKTHGKALGSARLSASSGEEAQENINLCDEGDKVDADYDFDKERYEVSSTYGYIGSLPKKLEDYGDTATFVIDEIGKTDSGKSYVVISAYE